MKILISLIFLLVFTACVEEEQKKTASITCDSSIQSNWLIEGSDTAIVGFANQEFGDSSYQQIFFDDSSSCAITFKFTGENCQGTIEGTFADYLGGGSGDPGCDYFEQSFSYFIEESTMQVCPESDPDNCDTLSALE